MKVLIFYNGLDFRAPEPQDDSWHNYHNENSPRLFLAACASWARLGCEPVRLSTVDITNKQEGFNFTRWLKRDLGRYPLTHWNVWHVWLKHAPCFVANMDVINQSFWGSSDGRLWAQGQEIPFDHSRACSLHVNGWTASVGYVTKTYCEQVIQMIERFDEKGFEVGSNPEWPNMICDDWLIRKFCPPEVHRPLCDFAYIKQGWQSAPLIQLARSTILRSLAAVPTL